MIYSFVTHLFHFIMWISFCQVHVDLYNNSVWLHGILVHVGPIFYNIIPWWTYRLFTTFNSIKMLKNQCTAIHIYVFV